jgi:hypothetical protein
VKRPYPDSGFANAGPREARVAKATTLLGRFVTKESRQRGNSLAAVALSSHHCHEHATRGVRADRVGAKLPARAIASGRCRTKRLCSLGRPLARDSRLAAHRKVRRHLRTPRRPMRKLGQRGCSSGRPEGRSRGVRANRGRARGSHRLQKSTGGAWPVSPPSEELGDNDVGSSLFARELEVANERRKPNRRRQSREIGGGSPTMAGTRESAPAGDTLSMEDALGRENRDR